METKKIISSRIFVTILIVLLMCLIILTGTYAWFTWNSPKNTELTMTIGKIVDVTFTSGNDITTALTPVYSYTDGEKTTFTINNRSTELFNYKVNLNISSIDTELISSDVKYALVKNGSIVTMNNLANASNNMTITLYNSSLLNTSDSFEFYLYIDGNKENDSSMMNNKSIVGTIMVEQGTPQTLASYITNLYTNTEKTEVENNTVSYNYATSVNLMNDRLGGTTVDYDGGNLRYYGASPNNYIYFNCSDYSNQSADTCELWRIIGVFDGKVKIIRNENIGTFSWDNKNTSTGAEDAYGKNDWTTARLMKLLNPSDYFAVDANDNGLGQSLYYTAQSGTCYSGYSNATKSCDFTSTGLKNDETRNMIAEVTWNLGGYSNTSVYSNQMYGYERGTTVYSGRSTSWTGKVALAYPSDYGYAADFSSCSKQLSGYNDATCTSVNWMKIMFGSVNNTWLLTPGSSYAHYAWYVYSSGYVYNFDNDTSSAYGVGPVLYLNSELTIESGDGSSSLPYRLSVS